jgi:YVTN family beta-propeller protein
VPIDFADTFRVATFDPEEDRIRYQVDWGDSAREWTSYYWGGTQVELRHAWTSRGTFPVKVMAQDTHGNCSGWSEPALVTVVGYPNRVVATIPDVTGPGDIALLPNGEYAYVTHEHNDSIYVIRTSDNSVVARLDGGGHPIGVTALPNGEYVYVAGCISGEVSVIRASDDSVVARVSLGRGLWDVAALPNGAAVYVTNYYDDEVSVIRTSDNAVVATIPIAAPSRGPKGIAAAPDGLRVYAADEQSGEVSVIGTTENAVVAVIEVWHYSTDMVSDAAVQPTGEYVYATTGAGVAVIRSSDNKVVSRVPVAAGAHGIAFLPEGDFAYLRSHDSDCVSVMRTRDNAVVSTITTGRGPWGLAASPDGQSVYVTNEDEGSISVIGY